MNKADAKRCATVRRSITKQIGSAMGANNLKWKDIARIVDKCPATITTRKQKHNWELEELFLLSRTLGISFRIGDADA